MKVIHTSDWHFGMLVGTDSYEACQRHFLEQLYELIRREDAKAVICAGDVYDSSVTNADAIRLFNDAATTLCQSLGATFLVIAGNHDSAARLASCRELLKAAGMYVTGRLERDVEPVLLDDGKVAVYLLPYFGRDEVSALFPEKKDSIRSVEDAMMVVCDHIRETMDRSRFNIVVSHAFIVSAELSESDRAARVGTASAVSKDVFKEFDYAALGHIHKPQVIDERIRYSGSPIPYSFGKEEQQDKGVVVIDTDRDERTFVALPPLRERLTVEGTWEEIMGREDLQDTYLRVYVTDRYAGLEMQAELREKFPYLLEVYGKSTSADGELTVLSVDDLQTLDERAIMVRFMEEHHGYTPNAEQLAWFDEVLAWSREEGTLS